MRVIVVLTSQDRRANDGRRTGFRFDEFATAYLTFTDAGAEVVIASPNGGAPPIDPESYDRSHPSPEISRLLSQPNAREALRDTLELRLVDASDFDAAFYPGCPGLPRDLAGSLDSMRILSDLHVARRPMAFLSEGSAALSGVCGHAGQPIVSGRTITLISGSECRTPLADVQMLERELRSGGANIIRGPDKAPHVVSDELLITGQNPASAPEVATLLLAAANRPYRNVT